MGGTTNRTRIQLEKEIENRGAHLNAFTAREMTLFFINCFKQDVQWAIDILGDMLCNST